MSSSSNTTPSNVSAAQRKQHEAAAFNFLPFTVDLFSRRDLRIKRAELLPIGRPEALTAEVVEALEDVITRGTLGFLCRAGGWRALEWGLPGQDEPISGMRLIDERLWADKRLRYSHHSIETLLITYNAVCQAGGQPYPDTPGKKKTHKDYPKQRNPKFKLNGDLLVHHQAFLKIRQAPFKVDEDYWRFLTNNPLTQVARLSLTAQEAPAILSRLMQPDLGMMMPWLGFHVVRSWREELRTRWDVLTRFHRLNESMVAWCDQLFEYAQQQERRDLLVPLLGFFEAHFERQGIEELWLREFNRLARDLRFADRSTYQKAWAACLDVAVKLREHYMDARDVHPIDREAPDRVFMTAYESSKIEPLVERAHALSNQLKSVIS